MSVDGSVYNRSKMNGLNAESASRVFDIRWYSNVLDR